MKKLYKPCIVTFTALPMYSLRVHTKFMGTILGRLSMGIIHSAAAREDQNRISRDKIIKFK